MIISMTVTGKDRPGIIASLTEAIYRAGGNLEDASMTILEGEFAMIVLVALKNKSIYTRLQKQLVVGGKELKLSISMTEIKHSLIRGEKHKSGTVPWVVSVLGKDRAGIVYQISKLFADHQLNITDLNSKIIGKGKKSTYALILEVDIPRAPQLIAQLKSKFQNLQKKLGVSIAFHPVEASSF